MAGPGLGARAGGGPVARAAAGSGPGQRLWLQHPPLPPASCRRVVSTSLTLPLQLLFGPAAALLDKIPNSRQLASTPVVGALFYPPANVHAVARAAVQAATDSSIPAGIMDAWQVAKFE